jgi:integrase
MLSGVALDRLLTFWDQLAQARCRGKWVHVGRVNSERRLRLFCCCGLRSGELCGLRRCDVDLVSCVLHIRQAVGDVGSAAVISLPKNDKQRDVPFPKALAPLFTAHEEVLIKRAARGLKDQTWHEYGLVFPGRSGEPLRPTSLRHMLKRLTDAAKLPAITTHMLRHTAAGLLEGAGCDRVTIGALLGHTPQSITGHYAPVSLTTLRPWIDQVYQMLHGDMTKIAAQSRAS